MPARAYHEGKVFQGKEHLHLQHKDLEKMDSMLNTTVETFFFFRGSLKIDVLNGDYFL